MLNVHHAQAWHLHSTEPQRVVVVAHLAAMLAFEGDGIVGGRPTLKNSPGKALPAPAPRIVWR